MENKGSSFIKGCLASFIVLALLMLLLGGSASIDLGGIIMLFIIGGVIGLIINAIYQKGKMMLSKLNHTMPSLITILAITFLITPLIACCPAWGPNGNPVQIAAQEVLIVWDKEQGIEHFVRRANFQTEKAPDDFGFLVPSPTQPKLSAVPDRIFEQLESLTKAKTKVLRKTKFSLMPMLFMPFTAKTELANSKSAQVESLRVEVLETAIIGSFEVAVLRASETDSLLEWLEENQYNARPELRDWVTPYIKKKWIITAFKYANDAEQNTTSLSPSSVCLSFETNAPFFPYRVPSDNRVEPQNGSLLRLYFAGQERVTGEFEAGTNRSWNARTKFSNHDDGMAEILKTVVKNPKDKTEIPNTHWLTAFEDHTWPGGAEDLYFSPSPSKNAIIPPPIIKANITTLHFPLDLILLGLATAFYFYKKKKAAQSA